MHRSRTAHIFLRPVSRSFFPVHQDRLLWALLCTERTVDAFSQRQRTFSPSGSGSRRLFFLRFDKCLALFCDSRFCIPLCHAQTFLRAGGNAAAALHTVEPVDRPCSCRSVYLDRCRRTGSRAEPAADTAADLYLHMSPHPLRIFCRLKRVLHCCRLSKRFLRTLPANVNTLVLSSIPCHLLRFSAESGVISFIPVVSYLSVQLMHGSMVRIRRGTSASWQPLSISTSGERLLVVGVLMRKRSRYFVPFPLT